MAESAATSRSRPRGVWLISAFFLLSAGWLLLSTLLIVTGVVPLDDAGQAYYDSVGGFDWFFSVAIAAVNLSGAICLFQLRKIAVSFFVVSLSLNVGLTLNQAGDDAGRLPR